MSRPDRIRRRRSRLAVGIALAGMMIPLGGCSEGTGNPPAGSISSVRKGSDAATPPAEAAKVPVQKGRAAVDR